MVLVIWNVLRATCFVFFIALTHERIKGAIMEASRALRRERWRLTVHQCHSRRLPTTNIFVANCTRVHHLFLWLSFVLFLRKGFERLIKRLLLLHTSLSAPDSEPFCYIIGRLRPQTLFQSHILLQLAILERQLRSARLLQGVLLQARA